MALLSPRHPHDKQTLTVRPDDMDDGIIRPYITVRNIWTLVAYHGGSRLISVRVRRRLLLPSQSYICNAFDVFISQGLKLRRIEKLYAIAKAAPYGALP